MLLGGKKIGAIRKPERSKPSGWKPERLESPRVVQNNHLCVAILQPSVQGESLTNPVLEGSDRLQHEANTQGFNVAGFKQRAKYDFFCWDFFFIKLLLLLEMQLPPMV